MRLIDDAQMQPIFFGIFLSIYLLAVFGNLLIILAVSFDSRLHTPMYFFLSNLSFVDLIFISTTVPKMMVDIQTHSRAIACVVCLTQMSLFLLFGSMDDLLLTVMAYDRFVAICHPLHYPVIMHPHLCGRLVVICYLVSFANSQVHNFVVLQSCCFKDVEISNFFCYPSQVFNISCSNSLAKNIVTYVFGVVFGCFPASGIFYSYYKIFSSIRKISSMQGRHKALSTCSSHLLVVCLFYGAGMWVYLGSYVSHSPRNLMMATFMHSVVTPMLNPYIYSLRNRDLSNTLKNLQRKMV